jgi:hypothetical protein
MERNKAGTPAAWATKYQGMKALLKSRWDIFEIIKAAILGGLVLLLVV